MVRLYLGPLLALSLLVLNAPLTPAAAETIRFNGTSKGKPVELTAEIVFPSDRPGPLPALLIVHGSGGVSREREYAYAEIATEMGVAAVIPDHFTGRGVRSTVTDQQSVLSIEMIQDAFTLLNRLAQDTRIDPKRIGITGFSKGGTVAVETALLRQADRFLPNGPRFALHVAFYPSCANQYRQTATDGAPILVLSGLEDTYVGWTTCRDYIARLAASGVNARQIAYPEAKHGWDGGRAYTVASGENYSRCIYAEQPDGSWIERTSGITFVDQKGRRSAEAYAAAVKACRTLGVSGGPNPRVKGLAIQELRAAITTTLKP